MSEIPKRSSGVEDTAPCVGCGLCCDGTLYSRARAEPEEESRLNALGLKLTTVEGKRYFELPCTQHDCGRCAIYETRFARCRSFRCALLRRYQRGEINLSDARDRVETAKRLISAVMPTDPAAAQDINRRRIRSQLHLNMQSADHAARAEMGARLVRIVALDDYLARWFLNKKPQTPA